MWDKMLDRILDALIQRGTLELTFPNGRLRRFGDGSGTPIKVRLADPDLPRNIVLRPELAVGEGYMDGTLTIENDDLAGFLSIAIINRAGVRQNWASWPANALKFLRGRIAQFNPMHRARENVAHHYDLSGQLYDLFLDEDRQYSCGYFKSPTDTLEQAQAQKKDHIARKLLISQDMTVLDIGCGWGGMALTLARDFGARVVGVTLSEEQYKVAVQRAAAAGLSDRVAFRLTDYRRLTERFDRVVSVGMFEHVGAPHYREFFRHLHSRLKPEGIALIHTIGRNAPPSFTSPWIDKYIFPGGYCPAMSEVMTAVEREDLWTTDVEVWRLHYAETLRHWYTRFMDNIDSATALFDERFCRMWRFYLLASELTFRLHNQCVFQFQIARDQHVVPLTRDYLYRDRTDAPALSQAAE